MDTLKEQYKGIVLKEQKSGSGSIKWPSSMSRMDEIFKTNPKISGLVGALDAGKKTSEVFQDLNKDPPEMENEKKKEEMPKQRITGKQIDPLKLDNSDNKLSAFEKAMLERFDEATKSALKLEEERLAVMKGMVHVFVQSLPREKNSTDEDGTPSRKRKKQEDVDTYESGGRDPDESDETYWIQKYSLLWKHKREVRNNTDWLGDEHMNAALDILWFTKLRKKGFQRGVYSTEQNKHIVQPCLQQLWLRRNHWALAYIDPHQNRCILYDSARHLSMNGTKDHEALLATAIDVTKYRMEWGDVQQQSDGSSCGLYAIAYAVDIANDIDPAAVKYIEQDMRLHLLYCFDRDMLKPFPRVT